LTDHREQLFDQFEPEKEAAVHSSSEEARDKAELFIARGEGEDCSSGP